MNLTIFLFFFKILLKTMAISVQFVALYNYFCCNWPLHTHTQNIYYIYVSLITHFKAIFVFFLSSLFPFLRFVFVPLFPVSGLTKNDIFEKEVFYSVSFKLPFLLFVISSSFSPSFFFPSH